VKALANGLPEQKEKTMKRLFVFVAVVSMSSAPAYAQGFTFGTLSNFIQVKLGGPCLIALPSGAVVQGPCASDPTQWWKVLPAESDPAFFTIENNNRCLDVPDNGQPALGKDLQVFRCHRQTNQQFRLTARGGGEWQIQPKQSNSLCLDIEGGWPTTGAPLQQYTCKSIDVDNQRFLLRPQTQQPDFLECGSTSQLRLTWREISTPHSITLFQGNAGYFPARSFEYRCGSFPWLLTFDCPDETRTIEVARNHPDRFRVKCAI
jgi:hypothetical protein